MLEGVERHWFCVRFVFRPDPSGTDRNQSAIFLLHRDLVGMFCAEKK